MLAVDAGVGIGDRSTYGQYVSYTYCDGLLLVKDALDKSKDVSPAGLRRGIEALGTDITYGDDVDVVVDLRERKGSLDEKALLRLITPDELAACRGKPTVYSSLRIKAKVKG